MLRFFLLKSSSQIFECVYSIHYFFTFSKYVNIRDNLIKITYPHRSINQRKSGLMKTSISYINAFIVKNTKRFLWLFLLSVLMWSPFKAYEQQLVYINLLDFSQYHYEKKEIHLKIRCEITFHSRIYSYVWKLFTYGTCIPFPFFKSVQILSKSLLCYYLKRLPSSSAQWNVSIVKSSYRKPYILHIFAISRPALIYLLKPRWHSIVKNTAEGERGGGERSTQGPRRLLPPPPACVLYRARNH